MEKKRRNMLLYVTATSVVGIACNDSRHAVGDVAPSPDFTVGKIAMVVRDAAPEPVVEDASPPKGTDAGADASSARATATPPREPGGKQPHWVGKMAPPPDK